MIGDIVVYKPCFNCNSDPNLECLNHKDEYQYISSELYEQYLSLPPIGRYKLIQTLIDLDFLDGGS